MIYNDFTLDGIEYRRGWSGIHIRPLFEMINDEVSATRSCMYFSQPIPDEDLDAWVKTGYGFLLDPERGLAWWKQRSGESTFDRVNQTATVRHRQSSIL